MKHSYPTSESLKFMLQMIDNREMALPDFQRDFVWDPNATEELIESIIENYPAGSLLRIKNGQQLVFRPRAVEGAPKLAADARPAYLILDGQQRLTSLYQGFYGTGEHRYVVDLAGLEAKKDLEDCVLHFSTRECDARYGTIQQQAETLVFPLGRLFRDAGFSSWTTEVLRLRCQDMDEMLDLQTRLSRLHEQWIKPIEEYEFPMVTLNEETAGGAVCTIFETLNRTGVKLGVFDLLTARFWAQDLNLRALWEEAQERTPLLAEYEIDPYYVLQIIGLLEPGVDREGRPRAPSVKRGAILEMHVDQARKGWRFAIEGLVEVLRILRGDCGVLKPWLLPYNTLLIPMAAIWASRRERKGLEIGADRLKVLRWFWCAVFGQRYENAPNSQAEKDYGELTRWMNGGVEPEAVSSFRMETLNLRTVRPKQRAVYRGVMALILQRGARDFHKRGHITAQLLDDKKNPVDDHHVFARAYLDEQGRPPHLRDCILNRTYIDRATNQRLSRQSPSRYLAQIREKHGLGAMEHVLESHFLPVGSDSPLLSNDFERFLSYRDDVLLRAIQERVGGEGLLGMTEPVHIAAIEEDVESDTSDQGADRESWERRATPESMGVVDRCVAVIQRQAPDVTLRYRQRYVGLERRGRPMHFVLFRPKESVVRVEPNIADRVGWTAKLERAGLRILGGGKRRLRLRISPDEFERNEALLAQLFEEAHREWTK